MSLTSVFGMGTGGPSSQSTPTHVDGYQPIFYIKEAIGFQPSQILSYTSAFVNTIFLKPKNILGICCRYRGRSSEVNSRHRNCDICMKKPHSFECGLCWRYLSSRAVTRQVLSALMSLTSVFGMGTGGPSSQSTPTICAFRHFLEKW